MELETKVRQLLAFASEFADLLYSSDIELSDDPIDACWQLAGILPVGVLDQVDLLKSESASQLIAKALEIATTAEQTLTAMMDQLGEQEDPGL
jgi:hypothetical protein